MNRWLLAMVAVLATTSQSLAVGFERVSVPDGDNPALEAGIWYPTDAAVSVQSLGTFKQTVAPGAAVKGERLPLIVFSHGSGGSFEGHYDTAIALAEAGFVVAGVTHTGDNYRDQSALTRVENRPRHIKRLVDFMVGAWPYRGRIDAKRIGMFGFSAGGFTTLAVIGGNPDLARVPPYCAANPQEWACQKAAGTRIDWATKPVTVEHDARITAAVIAAPALGFAFTPEGLRSITVPMQLWRGDQDEVLPHPRHAQHIYDSLPVKPDYRVVANAGHFVFLAPCSPALERVASAICKDPMGFDRVAFHREFNAATVAFLKAKLGEGM